MWFEMIYALPQTTTGYQVPIICGQNAGHHIYVDIGAESGDSVKLAFTFQGESSLRSWEIKVGQIPCASSSAPPQGCLQWLTGLKGQLTTFNFASTEDNHLANQGYSICIRQEAGFCCVQYSTCIETGSFSLSTNPVDLALQDEACTLDYIGKIAYYKVSNQVWDEKLFKFESFDMMGHDAARLCTAQRGAVPCRVITHPKQNNNYWNKSLSKTCWDT